MTAEVKNINIRKCEKTTTAGGTDYLRVHVEDEDANPYIFIDYNTERALKYTVKGDIFDFTLEIRRKVWKGKENIILEILEERYTGRNEYKDKEKL